MHGAKKGELSDCLEGNTVHGVIEKGPGQLDLLPQKVLADLQGAAHVPEGDHGALMALIPDVPGSRFFGGSQKMIVNNLNGWSVPEMSKTTDHQLRDRFVNELCQYSNFKMAPVSKFREKFRHKPL